MDLHLGRSKNQNFSMSGLLINAEAATPFGLINNLVMHNPVIPIAIEIAKAFSDKPSVAYKRTKARFRKIALLGFNEAIREGVSGQREAYRAGEAQAAVELFCQKIYKKLTGEDRSQTNRYVTINTNTPSCKTTASLPF